MTKVTNFVFHFRHGAEVNPLTRTFERLMRLCYCELHKRRFNMFILFFIFDVVQIEKQSFTKYLRQDKCYSARYLFTDLLKQWSRLPFDRLLGVHNVM